METIFFYNLANTIKSKIILFIENVHLDETDKDIQQLIRAARDRPKWKGLIRTWFQEGWL